MYCRIFQESSWWGDPYFVLADYRSYIEARQADLVYREPNLWAEKAMRVLLDQVSFLLIEQSASMQKKFGN